MVTCFMMIVQKQKKRNNKKEEKITISFHLGLKPSDIRDFIKPIIKKETDREHAPDCKVLVCLEH